MNTVHNDFRPVFTEKYAAGKHEFLKPDRKGVVYHFTSGEPRYNEPLCNEVLGITDEFLYPSKSKTYKKEP